MTTRRLLRFVLAASLALAAAPASASAEGTPETPAAVTAPGKMSLRLLKVGGTPLFTLAGERMYIRGKVTPYVAGQSVKVSFYRDHRRVQVQVAPVFPAGGAGEFRVSFASGAGTVEARAVHYANPQQAQFAGRTPAVTFVDTNLGPGSSGQSVRVLQSELSALHYVVPLSGFFDEATGRAVVAYRKVAGLERVSYSGKQVFRLLSRGVGAFPVRYRGDGRHVEANLNLQVLAEIEAGGRVHAIYTMSSGKPSTPTVLGRFRVYRREPGTNAHGMVDSSYFIRGYAIHGYFEVPVWAASHGCLRVPIPNAPSIYAWVQFGMPVDVYS